MRACGEWRRVLEQCSCLLLCRWWCGEVVYHHMDANTAPLIGHLQLGQLVTGPPLTRHETRCVYLLLLHYNTFAGAWPSYQPVLCCAVLCSAARRPLLSTPSHALVIITTGPLLWELHSARHPAVSLPIPSSALSRQCEPSSGL